ASLTWPLCAKSKLIFVVGLNGFGTFWCNAVTFGNASTPGSPPTSRPGNCWQAMLSVPWSVLFNSTSSGLPGGPPNVDRMSNQPKPVHPVFHFSVAFLFMMIAPVPTVEPAAYLWVMTAVPAAAAPSYARIAGQPPLSENVSVAKFLTVPSAYVNDVWPR